MNKMIAATAAFIRNIDISDLPNIAAESMIIVESNNAIIIDSIGCLLLSLCSFIINTPLIIPDCMYLCSLCRAEKIQSPNAGYYFN